MLLRLPKPLNLKNSGKEREECGVTAGIVLWWGVPGPLVPV